MRDPAGNNNPQLATDMLIARMGQEISQSPEPSRPLNTMLANGVLLALAVAIVVVLFLARPRADLVSVWTSWAVQFKVFGMLLLIGGGIRMLWAASIPGVAIKPALALLPAVLFLAAGAAFDSTGFPMLGTHALAVPACVGTILAAALAPMWILLTTLRRGIPTDLRRAGAVAGMLAGALAALAYTLACVNDGAGFVGLWYSFAIAVTGALGAFIGPKALAW